MLSFYLQAYLHGYTFITGGFSVLQAWQKMPVLHVISHCTRCKRAILLCLFQLTKMLTCSSCLCDCRSKADFCVHTVLAGLKIWPSQPISYLSSAWNIQVLFFCFFDKGGKGCKQKFETGYIFSNGLHVAIMDFGNTSHWVCITHRKWLYSHVLVVGQY